MLSYTLVLIYNIIINSNPGLASKNKSVIMHCGSIIIIMLQLAHECGKVLSGHWNIINHRMIGPQRKSSTYSEMAVRILSPILLLTVLASICIAQFAEPNAPYLVINQCKNCQRRRLMSHDQECSLEEATKQVQPCRCDADGTMYRDCCPSTHHTCLDSGEETVPFLCQDIILTSQGYNSTQW